MLKYELKKFISKKINKVILAAMLMLTVILSLLAAGSMTYTDEKGEHLTGISVLTAGRRLASDKNQWKGDLSAEKLTEIVKSYRELKQQYPEGIPDTEWGKNVQSYWDILYFAAKVYTTESDFIGNGMECLTEQDMVRLYDTYADNLRKMPEEYGDTPEQEAFLRERYKKIEIPIPYEADDSWDTMTVYLQAYVLIMAIVIGFLAAGIFDEEFRNHAEAVFFSSKYGRSKATVNKIAVGMITATLVYWTGVGLLSWIAFGIMGAGGFHTPYQFVDPYSIYVITEGQHYLLIAVSGYIASLLSASVTMLATAKTHNEKAAVCIPFFMYCVMLFIGGALSDITKMVYFTPDVLINMIRAVKTQFIFQIGGMVFSQIPFVIILYFTISVILLPFIYRSYSRYHLTKK